jgi:PAS domain S-box-containing protein
MDARVQGLPIVPFERAGEAWFRAVFDDAPVATVIATGSGRIIEVNAAFTALLGYPASEVRGCSVDDITHSEDLQLTRHVRVSLRSRRTSRRQYEKRYVHRNGSVVWACATVSAAQIGGMRYLIGQLLDLTPQRGAEAALRESQRRLGSLMDNLPGVAYRYRRGKQWTFDFVSEGVRALTGYSPQDFTGARPRIDVKTMMCEEDRERVRQLVRQALARRSSYEVRYRIRNAAGAMRWVWEKGTGVFSADGTLEALEGFINDVTAQVGDEAASAQLAAIVNESEDAIIGAALDGRVTSWNAGAEKLLGYRAEEALGLPARALIAPDRWPYIASRLAALAGGKPIRSIESSAVRKDGTRLAVELTLSPIRGIEGTAQSLSVVARNIEARKQHEAALARVNRTLKALWAGTSALVRATSEADLYEAMTRAIVDSAGYRLAWVAIAEHDEARSLRRVAAAGRGVEFLEHACRTWADAPGGQGACGRCVRTGLPQHLRLDRDPSTVDWSAEAEAAGLRSVVALPLRIDGQMFGALGIYAAEREAFAQADMELLGALADDLSFGIATFRARAEHQRTAERLERSMEATVQALAGTVEMRDPYTAGHQNRVAELAVRIGRELGLGEDRLHGVRLAACIHDIGKLAVPAELLSKPTRLTSLEYELVKTHADAGARILDGIEFPWPIREMVWQHHERCDGSGYPRGLKGEAILLEARIIAVADVIEAISSHRPYRAARGIDVGLAELSAGRGTRYDAAVVNACLRIYATAAPG